MEYLSFEDFATTVAVGIYVCVGALLCLHTFCPRLLTQVAGSVAKLTTGPMTLLSIGAAVGLLVVGIFGEDISNRLADADGQSKQYYWVFDSEKDMRDRTFRILVEELASARRLSPYALGEHESLLAQQLEAHPGKNLSRLSEEMEEARKGLASQIYYVAKNTLMNHDGYRGELQQIQTRIDFSRSFASYSAIFFLLALVLGTIQLLRIGITESPKPFEHICPRRWCFDWLATNSRYSRGKIARRVATRWVVVAGVFGLLFLVTRISFSAEEREFNLRTYGYFASLHVEELPTIYKNGDSGDAASEGAKHGGMLAEYGISGLALVGKDLLAVHDVKQPNLERRPYVSKISPDGTIKPMTLKNCTELPSDLEAICTIPERKGEILMAESGYYKGMFGRVFRGKVDADSIHINEVWNYPPETTDIEALVCVKHRGAYQLLLGNRNGTIHVADIEFGGDQGELQLKHLPLKMVSLPPETNDFNRKITDFSIDRAGSLYAVAANDPGDMHGSLGPFKSVVYQLGRIEQHDENPLKILEGDCLKWKVSGFKVEGLVVEDNKSITIGTDDEGYGGVWRRLSW